MYVTTTFSQAEINLNFETQANYYASNSLEIVVRVS